MSAPGLNEDDSVKNGGDSILSFNEELQRLRLKRVFSARKAGPVSTDYTVSITYEVFGYDPLDTGAAFTETLSYTQTIKNPCIDTSFVTIGKPATLGTEIEYILSSGQKNLP